MIDIKLLEKKAETETSYFDEYKKSLQNRGATTEALDQLMEMNAQRKKAITEAEQVKAQQNKLSQTVGQLKREGKDTSEIMRESTALGERVRELELKARDLDEKVFAISLTLPNKCHSSVPVGTSASENKEIKKMGTPTKFSFKAKEHWELGEKLGIIDFERAGKVTGTRFTFLKGKAAQLERGLIQFFMDLHSQEHGYQEMIPPYIVNSASYQGTGQFPKFVDDVFHLQGTDYHLISTAEVPVTNYYREEILKEEDLPLQFCAYSPCFRSEAGASGRDTKGLIRQHQFHKVELLMFTHPSQSYELHEKLTSHAERVLELLELPYKRMLLCTGDMGFGAAKCYDLEVWLPGPGEYREISSCSNFEDFQARRANIRFKSGTNKPQFVHTLNGSGLAVGRTLIAILENYQREDGSVAIPKVLQKYMGGASEIR
ncbi:MAG: serine--tRNA ligase [Oligoflexia bacterium]|nr:MAG: serine--tRNA ligase [Oligoflexia bacterium]